VAERRGVLIMAYGTPRTLDDVEAYYTDIRHGRPPSAEALEELTDRYRAIGGSPLLEITEAQARGIESRTGIRCYLGQKHAAPGIADAIEAMARDGVERAVGFVLAPHYSRMSIGDYEARARRAAKRIGWRGRLDVVTNWHLEPGYLDFLAREVTSAMDSLSDRARSRAVVIFSAHSLPERILQSNDPYPRQLRETAEGIAARTGLSEWRVAWQSAARTPDSWLGPDLAAAITDLGAAGVPGVVVCPCGFVADHLEVLYDVDIEAKKVALDAGLEFVRTAMPNDDPAFLDVAATVVGRAFAAP
jgi:protoporphyrin/coproporphyrin ferrochelatase